MPSVALLSKVPPKLMRMSLVLRSLPLAPVSLTRVAVRGAAL